MWLGTQPCCLECSQLCFQDPVFTSLSHHSPELAQHPFLYTAFWLVTPFSSLTTPPSPSQYPSFPFITPLTHLIPLSPSPCPPPSAPHLHTPTRSPLHLPLFTPHSSFPLPPPTLLLFHSSSLSLPPVIIHFLLSVCQVSLPQTQYLHAHILCPACPLFHLLSHSSNKDC